MDDSKTLDEFDTQEEYEAYILTLLVGDLIDVDDDDRALIFEYLRDTLDMEGGIDADVAKEMANQIKIIVGSEKALEPDPNTTH